MTTPQLGLPGRHSTLTRSDRWIAGLALAAALAGTAQASPMADGEVRILNFDLAPGAGAHHLSLAPFGYAGGALSIHFFGGLNLTGTDLGAFNLLDESNPPWSALPELIDGRFSAQVTAIGTPDLGDDHGVVNVYICNAQCTSFQTGTSSVGTDGRPPAVPNVPEPGSLLLVALAGLALAASRRRPAAA